jgi:hypothetical protein
MFHPLRTSEKDVQGKLRQFIDKQPSPVAFTMEFFGGYARRDHWLYIEVDKSSLDPEKVSIQIPEEAVRFFEESVAGVEEQNAWIAFHQDELRRRYAVLLGQRLRRSQLLDERSSRHLAVLSKNFYGALGIAEGLMAHKEPYSAGAVADVLERARDLMPTDVSKAHRSRFFYLRGALRTDLGDKRGALEDFETALSLWPVADNRAVTVLEALYRAAGDERALEQLRSRVKRPRR